MQMNWPQSWAITAIWFSFTAILALCDMPLIAAIILFASVIMSTIMISEG